MLKKLIVISTLLFVLSATSVAAETQTCTQVTQYGGAVSYICGAKTAVKPTGIADNLPLIGSSFVGASALLAAFSKKIKKLA